MLPDELENVALRHVPGGGILDIRRLSHGLVTETYRVLRDGSAYALRVAATNVDALGFDRDWEEQVLKNAVQANLAPLPVYCDPQRGILIARWVDGRMWNPADVRRSPNILRMAEFMRRIHALPMPMPARAMSPGKWIEHYCAAASRRATEPGGSGVPGTAAPYSADAAMRAAALARLAALAALPSVDPVVCHSDLHTLNLLDRGHSLMLLDWEYAHASDPLWDLAGWIANNDLEDEYEHDLLTSYGGRPPAPDEYLRLHLLGWLYDYVCLLWSELYLTLHGVARPGAGAPMITAPQAIAPRGTAAQTVITGGVMQGAVAQEDVPQECAALSAVSARARQLAARLSASM